MLSTIKGSSEKIYFNRLKEKYPESYNFESRLLLYFESIREAHQANVIDERVEISPIQILVIGKPDRCSVCARVRVSIGLVTETAPYKVYRGGSNEVSVKIPIDENLEAYWPVNFLEPIDLTVNID